MGANCCTAANNKPLQDAALSTYKNIKQSPSWTFRRRNKTHIEDTVDNPAQDSHNNSGNANIESKLRATIKCQLMDEGGSNESDSTLECKVSSKPSCSGGSSASRKLNSVPSNSSFFKGDPSSSRSYTSQPDHSPSIKAHNSPGYQVLDEISDSRIPFLNLSNEDRSPKARHSLVPSFCSNNLSIGGSRDRSFDGQTTNTFLELTSSQRERWSFDRENLTSIKCKVGKLIPQQPEPVSPGQQKCKICSKLLKKRSPWSSQKIVSTNELCVVSVLFCGHVYHAECLEKLTPEINKFDPSCPVCTNGEKSITRLLGKTESRARGNISRVVMADTDDLDGGIISESQKRAGKVHRMGASSSMKSSFSKSFLRRNFSIALRPSRSVNSVNESTMKKIFFWSRYLEF
ncbi:hypothetical protein Cni_G21281 [Canna indica]|uniref:RING-type domain-containing protein n=1 Tax=Canna indica TaxID=4628 RepID=A0AAQ3KQF7_9LILI|nr:hypothetical protein Cni_G21281 [Canna indica]